MAYNNQYGGYGTFPFPNYVNNFSQSYGQTPYTPQVQPQMPYQNQSNQPMQPPQNQHNNDGGGTFRYVNGIEGAKAFLVPPNTNILLFDSDSQQFYIKSANAQGQATLKHFEYKEISSNPNAVPPKQATTDYVTRDEFESLKNEISGFIQKIQKPKEVKPNV